MEPLATRVENGCAEEWRLMDYTCLLNVLETLRLREQGHRRVGLDRPGDDRVSG